MDVNEKLKPCPFCGGKAKQEVYYGGVTRYIVRCGNPDCPISVSADARDPQTSVEIWNHRFIDGDKGTWEYIPNTGKDNLNHAVGTWKLRKV